MTTATAQAAPVAPGTDAIAPRVMTGKAPGTEGTAAGRTVKFALLILFVLLILIPLYVLFVTSFKRSADVSASEAWTFPSVWSIEGWRAAWDSLSPALFRSVVLATAVAVLSAGLGSINGFVFAKWQFPGAECGVHALPLRDVHPLPGGHDPAAGDAPRRQGRPGSRGSRGSPSSSPSTSSSASRSAA